MTARRGGGWDVEDPLEARLRDVLETKADEMHVGTGLPLGTARRVRARRAGNAVAALAAVSVAVVGVAAATRLFAPTPALDTAGPPASGEAPSKEAVAGRREIVATGDVSGKRWALAGFSRNGDPCTEITVGAVGDQECDATVPATNDLAVESVHGRGLEKTVVFGKVSQEVTNVDVALNDRVVKARLEPTDRLEVQLYVAFVPERADGEVIASTAGGRVVQQQSLTDPGSLPLLDCTGEQVTDPSLACESGGTIDPGN
jgi:hypothetical protein